MTQLHEAHASLDQPRGPAPGTIDQGERSARLSLHFLWWLVVAPFVGFALAGRVFDLGAVGHWELWKAAIIGGLLSSPFAAGAYLGARAVTSGCRRGWFGLVGNGILAALAIGMPISEALTG